MMEDLTMQGVVPHAGKIVLHTQPPNSPDLNVNDLGLFRALEAAYLKKAPRNSNKLIQCVRDAHQEYPSAKINRLFLTLMSVMNMVIENHGCNHFKIPHMNKAKLEREKRLPITLQVTPFAAGFVILKSPFQLQLRTSSGPN
jgi:hypothetical protein